ncbi:unnamed protein product [Ascophyllum nodosum]
MHATKPAAAAAAAARTEGVHTEREAGHIMHVCTHFQIESICRSNHKHRRRILPLSDYHIMCRE